MMNYIIKGFFIQDEKLECRFEMELPSFAEVVEFLERVNFLFEAYDYVKVFPLIKEA